MCPLVGYKATPTFTPGVRSGSPGGVLVLETLLPRATRVDYLYNLYAVRHVGIVEEGTLGDTPETVPGTRRVVRFLFPGSREPRFSTFHCLYVR